MGKAKATGKKQKVRGAMSMQPKNVEAASLKALKNIKKSVAAKKDEASSALNRRGIILVNHLPFGFFEEEIRGFFSQYGQVLRVRVARSPKTGRPKGYAFVEFQYEGVAKIAAESMNNYLMFERLIKCKLLDSEALKQSKKIFKGKNITKTSFPTLYRRNKIKEEQDKPLTEEELEKAKTSRELRIEKHNQKLKELGIDYQFTISNVEEQLAEPQNATRKRKVSGSGDTEPSVTPTKKRISERKKSPEFKVDLESISDSEGSESDISIDMDNIFELPEIKEETVSPAARKKKDSPSPKTPPKKSSPKSPKNQTKKSLEKTKATPSPKVVTPKPTSTGTETPKKKKSLTKAKATPTPEAQVETPKKKKSSMTKDKATPEVQVETPKKNKSLTKAKSTPEAQVETPKKKAKKSIEKNSTGEIDVAVTPAKSIQSEPTTAPATGGKKKRKSFEKFSPKLTRSKAAGSTAVTPAKTTKTPITTTTAARKAKSMSAKELIPAEKKKRKSFEKFSPKLTRSKATGNLLNASGMETPNKIVKKKGRVSDISELKTFGNGNANATNKGKKASRKSCF